MSDETSRYQVERTFWKRRPDGWTVDVVDPLGVVCSVASVGSDDPEAVQSAQVIADALSGSDELRAENERLREALRQVHEIANRPDLWTEEVVERVIDRVSDALAAASLSETGGE